MEHTTECLVVALATGIIATTWVVIVLHFASRCWRRGQ